MADAYTVSASQGDHSEEHSRRSYTPASADYSLQAQNIVLFDAGNDKEHFNEFFRSSIEEYNARQKRSDRKKSLDYYDALQNGTEGYGKGKQQEKPIYDDVIQIGNRDTNGITKRTFDVDHWRELKTKGQFEEASKYVQEHLNHDKEQQELREVLTDVMREVLSESANSREYRKAHGLPPGKYDNILIHRMIGHGDEPNGTFHFDVGYTIFTDDDSTRKNGRSNGLSTRVSMTKGLAKMGFKTTKDSFALEKFRDDIKSRVQQKMEDRGYQRDIKGEHRHHMSTELYELEQRAKAAETTIAQAVENTQAVEDGKRQLQQDKDDFEIERKQHKKKADEKDKEQDARESSLQAREAALEVERQNIQAEIQRRAREAAEAATEDLRRELKREKLAAQHERVKYVRKVGEADALLDDLKAEKEYSQANPIDIPAALLDRKLMPRKLYTSQRGREIPMTEEQAKRLGYHEVVWQGKPVYEEPQTVRQAIDAANASAAQREASLQRLNSYDIRRSDLDRDWQFGE